MAYLKLLRPKDWAKNLFLYIPLFFGGEIFNIQKLIDITFGFIAFSFVASSIYIINDYRDREDDRTHPVKCKRPLAAGIRKDRTLGTTVTRPSASDMMPSPALGCVPGQ